MKGDTHYDGKEQKKSIKVHDVVALILLHDVLALVR
jgi:hypothetical protein